MTILGTLILDTSTPGALDKPMPYVNAEFSSALHTIKKQIALLHKFSGIIRRIGRETQDLKAITNFEIKDNEGNDLEPFLKDEFARHIRT